MAASDEVRRTGMKPPKKNPKNWRKNPVYNDLMFEHATSMVGDLAIREALKGATLEEKMVLSVALPEILKMIRKAPPVDPK